MQTQTKPGTTPASTGTSPEPGTIRVIFTLGRPHNDLYRFTQVVWLGPLEAYLKDFAIIEHGGEVSDPWYTDPLENYGPGHPDWDFNEDTEFTTHYAASILLPDGTWEDIPIRTKSGSYHRPTIWSGDTAQLQHEEDYHLPRINTEHWYHANPAPGIHPQHILCDTRPRRETTV